MSIINDALKKAQKSLIKNNKPQEEKPKENPPKTFDGESISNVYQKLYKNRGEQPGQPGAAGKKDADVVHLTPQKRPAFLWLKPVLKTLFFLACIAGGLYLARPYLPIDGFLASLKKSSQKRAYQQVRQAPPKRVYKPDELVLNGTSLIDGKNVALINDEIYEIGDTVNGMTIISIDKNNVELSNEEKVITLKVR